MVGIRAYILGLVSVSVPKCKASTLYEKTGRLKQCSLFKILYQINLFIFKFEIDKK